MVSPNVCQCCHPLCLPLPHSYKPCPVTCGTTVGDGATYVARLLDKLYAAGSAATTQVIDDHCRSLSAAKSKAGPLHNEKDSK